MAVTAPVVVSIPAQRAQEDNKEAGGLAPLAHHKKKGGFVNPWDSFTDQGMSPFVLWQMWRDWQSHPIPPPELLPQIVPVNWGQSSSASPAETAAWSKDLKSTWLGHACFLVEWPTPEGAPAGTRGARVLFDPVFSNRCSPSQYIGPARVTKPPINLKELPHVDAVVISHNHYDHLDVATLKHIASQPEGTVHFFAPLGNASWFTSTIGVKKDQVTELDWWGERDLKVKVGEGEGTEAHLRITATPCQHFTGRGLHDRNDTLWASWAVTSPTGGSVWFGGDTGYKSVPRGATSEEGLPVCPAFAEIGRRFGGFDLACIPIGAYSPRHIMSKVHCSPEDAVELHVAVKSKKSIGMHWATWVLTDEEMTEPPKRLRAACEVKGITPDQFGVCAIGETVRITPSLPSV
ncbi:beta-lactamase superfamily domain-domain-containing protein [Leucosporidium creatinivorum]|uniref:Beta-lactamase superfamily domain-domain-containing protein n=1 Tax=Leucosporidium creatinivorum TaxID=106004 RepID=A0A1Y2FMX4_9BASI|nr:beta-lactamase superfamily domain-domain-containing protein [Leucosporidium creatinivorum]